jgi:iron complex transport system ATP-binding protein
VKLSVESLSFSYPGRPVLRDVSLGVSPGEVVCLLGPNGSGKSTLVKCADALLAPSSGSVRVDGRDIRSLSRRELARLVAYVPQSASVLYSVSVLDLVLMGRRPHQSWRCGEADLDIAFDALETLDLADYALEEFNELSGGQQQRALIARALAQTPEVLLLDEPTSALDVARQLEVMEAVRDLADIGNLAVLMVMHDLSLSSRYSDSVVMMRDGRIVVRGSPADAITRETVELTYGVDCSVVHSDGAVAVIPRASSRSDLRCNAILPALVAGNG